MLAVIGQNFARVARFSGRDSRSQFWPYAALLFGLATFGTAATLLPAMLDSVARIQRFAAEHPELAHVEQGAGQYSITIEGSHPELMPDLTAASYGLPVVLLLFVLLSAAAVARRLHDRGKSGVWGFLPVPFLFTGLALFASAFHDLSAPEPSFGSFGLLLANNLLYLGLLGYLILLLAGPGAPGPNRYGPEPGSAH